MTYLVMENHFSYSVVLDNQGRFIKVANMGYTVGQTVGEIHPMEPKESRVISFRPFLILGSVAACFILVFTAIFGLRTPAPFASIYMTINPELRMDVDNTGTVLHIAPLTADAEQLLQEYSWKKKEMHLVSKELLDSAIQLGFLSEGGKVTIDIDAPDELWYQTTGISFRQELDNHLAEQMAVTIEIKEYTDSAPPESSVPPEESSRQTESSSSEESVVSSKSYSSSDYGSSSSKPVVEGQTPSESSTSPSPPSSSSKPTPPSSSAAGHKKEARSDDSGYTDYDSGYTDYDSGYTDYDSGYTDYDSGYTDYDSGYTDYDSGYTDYED